MPFPIVRNDISLMSADVIVSAANEHPLAGGGVRGPYSRPLGRQSSSPPARLSRPAPLAAP